VNLVDVNYQCSALATLRTYEDRSITKTSETESFMYIYAVMHMCMQLQKVI